jgi:16S rRNA (guanine527-N7)-methyltransferase
MDSARIAELLEPFLTTTITKTTTTAVPADSKRQGSCHSEPAQAGEEPARLSPSQLQSISTYIDILLRWNARINLTAIRDPEQIVTRHFGESLFAARHLFPRTIHPEAGSGRERAAVRSDETTTLGSEGGTAALLGRVKAPQTGALAPEAIADAPSRHRVTVADLGSGAGFPGIPIKVWASPIVLTLIESNHKKATFLREIVRALTLTDVDIQNARAENAFGGAFDVVTLRAVERFEAILPVAASLLAPGGRLTLLIGSAQLEIARSRLSSLSWSAPTPIPGSRSRHLVIAHSPA